MYVQKNITLWEISKIDEISEIRKEKHEKSMNEIRKNEMKTCELGNIPEKVNN